MRILVDGDACPNKEDIKRLAIQYQIEMFVYIDYAHVLEDDYYHVINCEVGNDSVDMAIINDSQKGDLVITQDYGLASLLLPKGVYILHISGMQIDNDNVDGLLMSRYLSAKQRRAQNRVKGPSKRTDEVKTYFLNQLEFILQNYKQ